MRFFSELFLNRPPPPPSVSLTISERHLPYLRAPPSHKRSRSLTSKKSLHVKQESIFCYMVLVLQIGIVGDVCLICIVMCSTLVSMWIDCQSAGYCPLFVSCYTCTLRMQIIMLLELKRKYSGEEVIACVASVSVTSQSKPVQSFGNMLCDGLWKRMDISKLERLVTRHGWCRVGLKL